jgi:transglutaminase-like putative cysteine protease
MRLQAARNQVQNLEIPVGARGTRQTLRLMSKLVREFRTADAIRRTAANIVEGFPSQAFRDEVRAVFGFVRDDIRYLGDVNEVETLQAPDVTLSTGQGDCDDKAILLASLLQSIGYKTQFVAVGFGEPGVFEHVYVRVLLGTVMVGLDPTVENGACAPTYTGEPCPGDMGWEPPDAVTHMIENT